VHEVRAAFIRVREVGGAGCGMDEATEAVYDRLADVYDANRHAAWPDHLSRFLDRADPDRPVLDAGCGTGIYLPALAAHPADVVGTDRIAAMLARARGTLVQASHEHLPFADESMGGVWSRHSCVHTPHDELPMVLRELRRTIPVGAPLSLSLIARRDGAPLSFVSGDDLPGRTFWTWDADHLDDLLVGAGFEGGRSALHAREIDGHDVSCVWAETERVRSIADTVAAGTRLLVCGLNPSLRAADAGIGFVTPGNRFWPAAIEAGLASRDRDPEHALRHHGLGMTDLVKRATPRAAELTKPEYGEGLNRIDRLCRRLRPGAVCFVGLAGWRAAADRNATAGPQRQDLGGRPVYVVPSTSGLNGSSQHPDFVNHFRAALALADRAA